MNLREQISLEEENAKKEKLEKTNYKNSEEYKIKMNFINYYNGQVISEEYKEKILDELQKCIDEETINNSFLKEEILKSMKLNKLPKELKIAYKYILKNDECNKYVDLFNKILLNNNIELIKYNYTINDLEDRIIRIVSTLLNDTLQNGIKVVDGKDIFPFNKYSISNINIRIILGDNDFSELFRLKNDHYYLLDDGFLVENWMIIIYMKYLVSKSKIVYSKNIPGKYWYTHYSHLSEDNLKKLKKYGFNYCILPFENIKENNQHYYLLFDNSISLEEAKKYYKENLNTYKKAEVLFEKEINIIVDNIKNIYLRENEDLNAYIKKIINDNNLLDNCKIYFSYNYYREYRCSLLMIKNNFVAKYVIVLDNLNKEHTNLIYKSHNLVSIGMISKNDLILISNENSEITTKQTIIEGSTITTKPKQHSVIGSAIVGSMIAGSTGSIIGAASAMDKNIRNQNESKTIKVEPLVANIKNEFNYLTIYFYLEKTSSFEETSLSWSKRSILGKNNDEITAENNKIISELENIFSLENILLGEITAEYLVNASNYDEEQLNEYINREIQSRKAKAIEEYWKLHKKEKNKLDQDLVQLKEEEQAIRNSISKFDADNEKIISNFNQQKEAKSEKEKLYVQSTNKIKKLQDELNQLGIFKINKKNELKSIISEEQKKLIVLEKECKFEKQQKLQEIEDKIKPINNERELLVKQLNDVLLKQDDILKTIEKIY